MFNHSHRFAHSISQWGHRAIILPTCVLGLLVFAPLAQAQDGGPDPATSVEVSGATIWRDAVTTGSVTVTCYDAAGKPVPNDTVYISITSPGEIGTQFGSIYTYSSSTSGTTDSNGTVTVTAKSTDLTLVGNDATATVTATADAASGKGAVLFKGALQLLVGKADATNKTSKCNIGEQQLLLAKLLSGVSCTATWASSGATPIEDWDGVDSPSATTTTPFPPSNYMNPVIQLYLTTTGSNTTTATANDGAATASVSTNFTVSSPNDFTITAQQLAAADGNLAVGLGTADPNSPIEGINFNRSGGAGGTLSFVQIVNTNNWTYTDNNGPHNMTKPSLPGLDNSIPYPDSKNPPNTTNDSPNESYVGAKNVTELNMTSWSATMYLMWQSNTRPSIPIPVESIAWSWSADAKFNSSTGSPTSFSGSKSTSYSKGTALNNGVLTWTGKTFNSDAAIPVPTK